jgi:hypothetical protein
MPTAANPTIAPTMEWVDNPLADCRRHFSAGEHGSGELENGGYQDGLPNGERPRAD